MIIVRCNKCGKEVAWHSTDRLPEQWSRVGDRELCGNCTKEYNKYRETLDKELETKIECYFN